MKRQTTDFKVLASSCFTGNGESYNPLCNQNREINRNTSKVSSESVPIQEPASLVNKEGPHLPTGKYQIPMVTLKKNTKIWANVQCGDPTCPMFILPYPVSPNCDGQNLLFIHRNKHTYIITQRKYSYIISLYKKNVIIY